MTIKNNVTIDQVLNFSDMARVTTSYMQNQRHSLVSQKYQPIQAASVGQALNEKGFTLVSCMTGKARQEDKASHQRTIARYRHNDDFEIQGLKLDIIYISKHMGRGCDEFRLGFYRGVCANQWAVGTLFANVRIRHNENALVAINNGLAEVLAQRQKLIETIQKMQSIQLNGTQIAELAKKFTEIRLEGKTNIVDTNWESLARVHRLEDQKTDLFTVANVLQENIVNAPLQYRVNSTDASGVSYIRNMTTRQLKESSTQLVELNSKMFDAAMELMAA